MDDILGDIMGDDYDEEVDYEDADDVVVPAKKVPVEPKEVKETSLDTAPKTAENPIDHVQAQRKESQTAALPLSQSQQQQKRRLSPPRGPRRNNSSGVNATPIGARRSIEPTRQRDEPFRQREADTYGPGPVERDRPRDARGPLPPRVDERRRPLSPRRPGPRDDLPPRPRGHLDRPRGPIDNDRHNGPPVDRHRGPPPPRDRPANNSTSLDSKVEPRQAPKQPLRRDESANDSERLRGPIRSPPRQPPLRRNDSLPDRGDIGPPRGPPRESREARDLPRGARDIPRDLPRNIDHRDGPPRDITRDNRDGPLRNFDARDGPPRESRQPRSIDNRDGPQVRPMNGPPDRTRGNGPDSRPGPDGPPRSSLPPRHRDGPSRPRPRTPPYNVRKPAVPPNAPPPRFFLMKTASMDNIRIAQDMDVWAASVKNQDALRAAFQAGKVYLVFSVNASGHFQGYAEMMTDVGAVPPAQWDLSDVKVQYSGTFGLRWFRRCNLEFGRTRNLYNKLNENKLVKIGYDGQEIDRDCGKALCDMLDDLPEEKPKVHSVLKDSDKKQPRKQNGVKRAASPSAELRDNGKRQAAEGAKNTPVAAVVKDDAAVAVTKDDTAVMQVDQGGDSVMQAAKMEVDKADRSKSAPPESEAKSHAEVASIEKVAQGLQIRGRGRGQGQGQKEATPTTPRTPTGPRSLVDRLNPFATDKAQDRRPLKPQESIFNNSRGGRGQRGGGRRGGGGGRR